MDDDDDDDGGGGSDDDDNDYDDDDDQPLVARLSDSCSTSTMLAPKMSYYLVLYVIQFSFTLSSSFS